MTMRIGLITGEYPPMVGGVGAFTLELAKALANLGHEIHIITDRRARPEGVRKSLWDIREPFSLDYGFLHARIHRWWWSALGTIAQIAGQYDLQIINLQYQALAYSMRIPAINFLPMRMRGMCQTVVTFHDLRVPYLFPKAGRLRPWIVRHLARSADGVIATNDQDFSQLDGLRALRQIPIGSNIPAVSTKARVVSDLRSGLGVGPDDFLLGYFGFLSESKGADLLLAALQSLDQSYHLAFFGGKSRSGGSASDKHFIEQITLQIRQSNLERRVHFSGYLPSDKISAFFSASDLIILPYRDGVSLRRGTLMASLAHGRPTLTTASDRGDESLKHGENVWMTPVDETQGLVDAIRYLRRHPQVRETLGHGAAVLVESFSWNRIAEKTAAFYAELIENSAA